MTRLSLQETCLLDLSGELGDKATAQLREHVAQYPAALLEYELLRGPYDLLRSLPKLPPELATDDARRQTADAIKRGIHKKLHESERRANAQKRWRLTYAALAGITSVAACLVITGSVYWVKDNLRATQRQAAEAAAQLQELANADDAANPTDQALSSVASDLTSLEQSNAPGIARGESDQPLMNLLDALDTVKQNRAYPPAEDAPGL